MLSRWIPAAGRQRGLLLPSLRSRAYSYGRVADAAARDGELRLFVVAGEVSGDSLASRLMASLRELSPVPVRFAGVGGSGFTPVPTFLVQFFTLCVLAKYHYGILTPLNIS
jgi:lipid-A-disaccharide synthase